MIIYENQCIDLGQRHGTNIIGGCKLLCGVPVGPGDTAADQRSTRDRESITSNYSAAQHTSTAAGFSSVMRYGMAHRSILVLACQPRRVDELIQLSILIYLSHLIELGNSFTYA